MGWLQPDKNPKFPNEQEDRDQLEDEQCKKDVEWLCCFWRVLEHITQCKDIEQKAADSEDDG